MDTIENFLQKVEDGYFKSVCHFYYPHIGGERVCFYRSTTGSTTGDGYALYIEGDFAEQKLFQISKIFVDMADNLPYDVYRTDLYAVGLLNIFHLSQQQVW